MCSKIHRDHTLSPFSLDGLKFNSVDGKVNRQSHMGEYKLDDKEDSVGRPL